MRKEYVRPTGENLTLTNGRAGPELMIASISSKGAQVLTSPSTS
jgi:hypothetical protein